jgi:hypothetical protein
MRRVNDRNYFNCWQILYRATCPSPNQTHWRVADVDWRKERHSFSGVDYSVIFEVHYLRYVVRDSASWTLMVALEHWWDGNGESVKDTSWARVIKGNPRMIVSWLQQQEKVRAALHGKVIPEPAPGAD